MLCSIKELGDFKPAARDGDIGHVREVLFDDERWVIRHLVVDTGGWLSGRDVLISPHSIERLDPSRRRVAISLTREQIQDAPDVATDKPVSRQQEIPYYDYYGFPYYWAGAGLWGAAAYPMGGAALAVPPADAQIPRDADERAAAERAASDVHLRSSAEVIGYDIAASDGNIGHIDDFLYDDHSWQIRYAVVDTRNWLPGRLVLIAPEWIESVDWGERHARVKMTREQVKSSPAYDRSKTLSRQDEEQLGRHYGV